MPVVSRMPAGARTGCLVNFRLVGSIYMLRGAPRGHDSSVANYRKQESLDSQALDLPIHDFRILPRKSIFATEPEFLPTCVHNDVSRCNRWHAITTAARLSSLRNSTFHRALMRAHGAGPTRQRDRSRPPRALGVEPSTR